MANRSDDTRKKFILTLDINMMEQIRTIAKKSHLTTSYVVECILKHNLERVDFVTFKVVEKD